VNGSTVPQATWRAPVSRCPGHNLEDFCFDAQQAAEKAVKAVFIRRAMPFPYVHDLERLLKLLARGGVKIPKYVWKAKEPTPFAYQTRYPGHSPPVGPRLYRRAVRIAGDVLRWAERQIAKP
jgi:HEPN domain-containing protein